MKITRVKHNDIIKVEGPDGYTAWLENETPHEEAEITLPTGLGGAVYKLSKARIIVALMTALIAEYDQNGART